MTNKLAIRKRLAVPTKLITQPRSLRPTFCGRLSSQRVENPALESVLNLAFIMTA